MDVADKGLISLTFNSGDIVIYQQQCVIGVSWREKIKIIVVRRKAGKHV